MTGLHEDGRRAYAGETEDDADEDLVTELLESEAAEREQRLAELTRSDPERARRVDSRLGTLGQLGFAVDAPGRAALLPARFGRFVREGRVAAGGMGEVHLARDVETGARAALKLVRPELLWFDTARERFRREVEATAALHHPGIVRVIGVGEEGAVPWIAMEWVGGASLEEVVERLRGRAPDALTRADFVRTVEELAGSRPEPEAARAGAFPGADWVAVVTGLCVRIAGALEHAHAAGVLHRDVKPSNVLVTSAGRVLLADFGLALPRDADRLTRTGSWIGSLPYAAPEQIEGSPRRLDARADVYSLGATLYELLTLRTPFLGGPESAVRRRVVTGELERPRRIHARVPRAVEDACLAALDPDPARRPASARAFADELERALAGLAVSVRPAPAWLRAARWARRRPARAASVVTSAVVVIGSIAFALREAATAARLTRLADAELVRALDREAAGFWPAAPHAEAAMEAWCARAVELASRRAEHQRALDELARRAQAYADVDRRADQGPSREFLATLARELEALSVFLARAPATPPDPAITREREARLRARLDSEPDAVAVELEQRIAELREPPARDPAAWQPDRVQLADFARRLSAVRAELARRKTFRFDDPLDAWRHQSLLQLVGDLDRLALLYERVGQHLARTRELTALAEGPGRARWEEARRAVLAEPAYAGLVLEPIFGLLPLERDPASGLWEFLVAESGAAPERAHDGRWRLTPETGIVLVLLPGGRFEMGQRADEGAPFQGAGPLHAVDLAPFFLARYELTLEQARRLGALDTTSSVPVHALPPATLDWHEARRILHAVGLELPTEAQWEYAARAGGSERVELAGSANVLPEGGDEDSSADAGGRPGPDDGWPDVAPVGSFRPNAFGLHDTLGNVAEWCLDTFVGRAYATLVPRAGDGLRDTVTVGQLRSVRGGSYLHTPAQVGFHQRRGEPHSRRFYGTGVRPARGLAPD